jgi:hypothetical protein
MSRANHEDALATRRGRWELSVVGSDDVAMREHRVRSYGRSSCDDSGGSFWLSMTTGWEGKAAGKKRKVEGPRRKATRAWYSGGWRVAPSR